MGVYIKGLNLPEHGVVIFIHGDGTVTTEFGHQIVGTAIPVPDHGRLVDAVKEFPAADVVEVVHASWVWNPDGMDWGIGAWVCGKCKSRPETWWNTVQECHPLRCAGSHYCGNCGAKMDGGQEPPKEVIDE